MRKRRKKIKIKKIIIFLVIIIVIFLGVILIFKHPKEKETAINNNKTPTTEKNEPQIKTLTMIMAGDSLINDYLYQDAKREANNEGYDFKPYLKLVKEKIKNYDLAYYNQETILGGTSIGLSTYPAFNSPWEVGDAMIDAGFNIVSLATNHTLDRKEQAVLLSREYWNKQENVYAIGSYSSQAEKEELENKIFEKNGITYAILNYTYGTNGIAVPEGKSYLVNLWNDTTNYEGYKETVLKDIANLRNRVDVLMVAMHWGREYTHTPTDLVKKTAKFLAENDVDIIIGTHPHVIEPVEWIDDTLVFYSLGNFLSSQTSDSCSNYKCNIGLLSSLTITKTIDNDNIDIKIDNINNELIYMYNNNYHDYLIIPFSNQEIKTHLNNYENVYNNYAKIISSTDERIKTVPLAG